MTTKPEVWCELWRLSKDELEGDAKNFATAIIAAHPGLIPPVLLAANVTELRRMLAIAFVAGRRWHGGAGESPSDAAAFARAFADAKRQDGAK